MLANHRDLIEMVLKYQNNADFFRDFSENSSEHNNFHISFRDEIMKKPLIHIFEVESFKSYNTAAK